MTAFVFINFPGPVIHPVGHWVSHSVGTRSLPFALSPSVSPTVFRSFGLSVCLSVFPSLSVGLPSQLLLILYIQISSLCTSGPRMRERTAVIFPNYGWPTSQPARHTAQTDPILYGGCPRAGDYGGYQVGCEVLILKSVTLECAAQVTDQVGDWLTDWRSNRADSLAGFPSNDLWFNIFKS